MIILGINTYHGDVSAVLVRGGELVASVEEAGPVVVTDRIGFRYEVPDVREP